MIPFSSKLSPSLICLDMLHLESEIRKVEALTDSLHVDILDGHFSPSMPLGFETVRQLRKVTNLKFDCHVMVKDPEYFIDELLNIGVNSICVQVEGLIHVDGILQKIKAAGVEAGLAFAPGTPLNVLKCVASRCDRILLMQIEPGYASFSGEKKVPYAKAKLLDAKRYGIPIVLDGRVGESDVEANIANQFVCGSTLLPKLWKNN